MPLYEYECGACGHRFERIQRFSDPLVHECPACGQGPVNKLLSAPAIQFKGTGWYITDYAGKKSGASQSPQEKADKQGEAARADAKTEGKSEGKSETKSETKAETKSESKSDSSAGSSSSAPASTPGPSKS